MVTKFCFVQCGTSGDCEATLPGSISCLDQGRSRHRPAVAPTAATDGHQLFQMYKLCQSVYHDWHLHTRPGQIQIGDTQLTSQLITYQPGSLVIGT